jgi:hypothetical protein
MLLSKDEFNRTLMTLIESARGGLIVMIKYDFDVSALSNDFICVDHNHLRHQRPIVNNWHPSWLENNIVT